MSCMFFNKKNVPLYIDWNKSSLLVNNDKVAYWEDKVITRSRSRNTTRYYDVYEFYPALLNTYLLASQYGMSESTSSRPERITALPPDARYFKVKFNLSSLDIYPSAPYKKVIGERVKVGNWGEKEVKDSLFTKSFIQSNSPLFFKNFLVLSYSENFSNEFYIDNQFYISKIIEMSKGFYKGVKINDQYPYPYINKISFSKLIPLPSSMEYRDTHCAYIYPSGRQCSFTKTNGSNFCHTHSKNK